MQTVWTTQRLNSLRILAECSKVYEVTNDYRRDWTLGITKMKEQYPEEWKLLKGISLKMIKYAWSKYGKACYGICTVKDCRNKIVPGEVYCPEHAKVSNYHRGTFSSPCIKNNIDLVPKIVKTRDQKLLAEVVIRNITKLSYVDKKEVLGEEFEKQIVEKEKSKRRKV